MSRQRSPKEKAMHLLRSEAYAAAMKATPRPWPEAVGKWPADDRVAYLQALRAEYLRQVAAHRQAMGCGMTGIDPNA
jgi:hypothetical protein